MQERGGVFSGQRRFTNVRAPEKPGVLAEGRERRAKSFRHRLNPGVAAKRQRLDGMREKRLQCGSDVPRRISEAGTLPVDQHEIRRCAGPPSRLRQYVFPTNISMHQRDRRPPPAKLVYARCDEGVALNGLQELQLERGDVAEDLRAGACELERPWRHLRQCGARGYIGTATQVVARGERSGQFRCDGRNVVGSESRKLLCVSGTRAQFQHEDSRIGIEQMNSWKERPQASVGTVCLSAPVQAGFELERADSARGFVLDEVPRTCRAMHAQVAVPGRTVRHADLAANDILRVEETRSHEVGNGLVGPHSIVVNCTVGARPIAWASRRLKGRRLTRANRRLARTWLLGARIRRSRARFWRARLRRQTRLFGAWIRRGRARLRRVW